jgi:hypothetical protein
VNTIFPRLRPAPTFLSAEAPSATAVVDAIVPFIPVLVTAVAVKPVTLETSAAIVFVFTDAIFVASSISVPPAFVN